MIVFDIEASGLDPQSYPIEIAWQDSKDQANFDSFLIKPHENWTYWDDYAENEIHHISRLECIEKGISIEEACGRLNSRLNGKTIYSDAIEHDRNWMMTLFNETLLMPAFSFDSIYELIGSIDQFEYDEFIENATVTHRALDDARFIIRCLQCVPHLKNA